MNLGDLSIAVRERNMTEIYDLSILICRKYWWQLSLLIGISYAPFCLLNIALFYSDTHSDDSFSILPYIVLLAEIPIITAACTLFLGNSLFHGNCGIRHCLRESLQRLPALFFYGIFKIALLISPAHMVEIILLEKLKGIRSWKRGMRLISSWRQDYLAYLLINTGLFVISMVMFVVLSEHLLSLFMHAQQPITTEFSEGFFAHFNIINLESNIAGHIVLAPIILFFTVVRFLAYINLRTVREGWSTELQIKHAAQRVFGEIRS